MMRILFVKWLTYAYKHVTTYHLYSSKLLSSEPTILIIMPSGICWQGVVVRPLIIVKYFQTRAFLLLSIIEGSDAHKNTSWPDAFFPLDYLITKEKFKQGGASTL